MHQPFVLCPSQFPWKVWWETSSKDTYLFYLFVCTLAALMDQVPQNTNQSSEEAGPLIKLT